MLNFTSGKILAQITGGECDGEILFVDDIDDFDSSIDEFEALVLEEGKIIPLLNIDERSVNYIAGPSGSGKTTYAINLVKNYKKIYPNKDFFLFSRTDYKNDPAFKGMKINQINIDDSLLNNPINIEKELTGGCILLFDDCNTIQNDKLKKCIDKLMTDVLEIGRKLDITIIITSHLVIPNDKKIARTIMNEIHSMTIFPKSGSSQQISYSLKTYFGFNRSNIQNILDSKSRWVTINRTYPMTLLYENGAYIL